MSFSIIIHGGAWDIPVAAHQAHIDGLEKALHTGIDLLKQQSDPVSVVVEIVKVLEADPTFDAGCGSFLNRNAQVEMDAVVMDGRDMSAGAVAAIQNVEHPVQVANHLRENSDHVFLVGDGATQYAHANGFAYHPTEKLLIGRELERFKQLQKENEIKTRRFFEHDTVGAVVFDHNRNIAVATSTGGTPHKLPGRVGDSPVIGAGAYADNPIGGASATGWGESLLKIVAAKTAVDYMGQTHNAQQAAGYTIDILEKKVDGRGGIICIDSDGNTGVAYNTPFMARGLATNAGIISIEI
jgi:beta-aspartyl-peptidase (threonine type)